MVVRFLIAVLSGMLVGVVLYEGLLAAHGLFFTARVPIAVVAGDHAHAVVNLNIAFYWALGASASTLMATGIAQNRLAGTLCALCWMLALLLKIGLNTQSMALLSLALSISALAWLISLRLIPRNSV